MKFFKPFPKSCLFAVIGVAGILAGTTSVFSQETTRLSNPVAVFSGLDKITGRITTFDVYIGETYQFGALQVTPRVCYSNSADEATRTDGFVEVNEITLDKK
ncbi:putative DUF2155 protein [Bartonella choladocola]|uniref:DUF2155 protein n=2 Tax=Bartonellaceae TaxID=772 RepID=A0A1U9MH85_9HYPH|nr:putative DUF2155 protein [Bartonella choladocola]